MPQQTILYLHGFASTDQGAKATFLREKAGDHPGVVCLAINFNPTPRDFEFMTITGMINRLRQFVLEREPARLSLIGSSMGAVVGLNYARRFGGVDRLLLLAPALSYLDRLRTEEEAARWRERGAIDIFHFGFHRPLPLRYDFEADGRAYRQSPPPPAPIRILHGRHDDVVPIQHSRDYAARYPDRVSLRVMDADHTLNDHLDVIWQETIDFLVCKSER